MGSLETTLRNELTIADFDWNNGRILYQEICGEYSYPGWAGEHLLETREISHDDEILDFEFYAGYGGPLMPRFVAEDDEFIYFPTQYDGATSICKVAKSINYYVGNNRETPYPGGG